MEDNFNKDPEAKPKTKTSSTEDAKEPGITAGESEVQNGIGIANHPENKTYDKSLEQDVYLDEANNNTANGNDDPVQDGIGMSM